MEEPPFVNVMDMFVERLTGVEAALERIEAGQAEAAAERLRAQREAVFEEEAYGMRHGEFGNPIVGDYNVRRVTVSMSGAEDEDEGDGDRYSFPRTSDAIASFWLHGVRHAAVTPPNSPAGRPDYAALEPCARGALERHQLRLVKVGVNEDQESVHIYMLLGSYKQPLKSWDEWAAIAYEVMGDCLTQQGNAEWLPGEARVDLEPHHRASTIIAGIEYHLDVRTGAPH